MSLDSLVTGAFGLVSPMTAKKPSSGIPARRKRVVARTTHFFCEKKNLLRRIANRILGLVARWAPGATTVRPFLHRLRGVRITGRVFIGDDVYMENEYPECIEAGGRCPDMLAFGSGGPYPRRRGQSYSERILSSEPTV